jgi:hypothetical protein
MECEFYFVSDIERLFGDVDMEGIDLVKNNETMTKLSCMYYILRNAENDDDDDDDKEEIINADYHKFILEPLETLEIEDVFLHDNGLMRCCDDTLPYILDNFKQLLYRDADHRMQAVQYTREERPRKRTRLAL